MRIIKNICLVLLTFFANQAIAANAQTTVNFDRPEKFTDFKTNSPIKERKLMKELQELIMASSNKILPKDTKLEILITDIDLAGRFEYGAVDQFRVVNNKDKVKLEFSYKMLDINGKIILEDDVSLISLDPMSLRNKPNKYKHTHFTYEMPVYNRWLRQLIQ